MADSVGTLNVRIIKGTDLAVRDSWRRSSDPYVVVSLGHQKTKTRVIKKNLNPTWDEELSLPILQSSPLPLLKLEVFDKDLIGRDGKMGNGEVDLEDLASAVRMRRTNPSSSMPKNKENESSSCIKCVDGQMVKEVSLRLQNVESGRLEVHIKWVDLTMGMPSMSKNLCTRDEVIAQFESVKDSYNVDDLINAINALLENTQTGHKPAQDKIQEQDKNKITWTSLIKSGSVFLKFANDHIEKLDKEDSSHSRETTKIASHILEQVGNMHWMVGGLSIIAYLLQKIEKVSQNRTECLQLLKYMVDLANHTKKLRVEIPNEEEKLKNAILIIVKGCIECAAQLHSRKMFSFLKTSVNSETLSNVQKEINQLYPDLILTAIIEWKQQHPVTLPISPPSYPNDAVGIEDRVQEVMKLLSTTTDGSSRAVVIYGLGGIGKTTLADAVLAKLSLKDYNYTRVAIDIEPSKNDIKSLQQIILKDGFPKYEGGREIKLRDWQEGQLCLTKAFKCESNRFLFLFIDNGLRADDLKQLLPADLRGLPKNSRILVTTTNLGQTDMFEQCGLSREQYPVNKLSDDAALKILCKDPANLQHMKEEEWKNILRICGGIPLILKLACARLAKMGYKAERCTQLFEALEKGENIEEENLTSRIIDYEYDRLEKSAREAFLDICCFFSHWNRRHVEYIVGAEQLKSLQEAALLTTFETSISKRNILEMEEERLIVHDVIRAKGQNMSQSTRIMDVQSFIEAAEDPKRLSEIKGVWLRDDVFDDDDDDDDGDVLVVEERNFNLMRNSLRVLCMGNRIKVNGQSQMKFKELRYLSIGPDIPLLSLKFEALERLGVYKGPIFDGGVNLLYKLPPKLKRIKAVTSKVSNTCKELEGSQSIPAVQNFCLEELKLQDGLPSLPEGIHHYANSLKILNFDRPEKIGELPEYVLGLPSLSKLRIRDWYKLEWQPESFGKLTSLTHLELTLAIRLKELPLSFCELKSLKYLRLCYCEGLKELPSNFGQLSGLKYLDLRGCGLQELPLSFAQLSSLKRLDLLFCKQLKGLPSRFGQLTALEYLNLSFCDKLENLPSTFVQLKALKNLSLEGCTELKEVGFPLEELTSLECLDLTECPKLNVDLSQIQNRVNIER